MTTVSMITGLTNMQKLIKFKNAGGMGTQVPILKEKLESRGIRVFIDKFRDVDIYHIHTPLVEGMYAGIKGRIINRPVVVHARHLPELVTNSFHGGKIVNVMAEKQARYFYNLADVVVCGSSYTRDKLKSLGINKKMEIIPNGVNREKFKFSEEGRAEARKKLLLGDDDFLVTGVGLAIKRKGIVDFYDVARRFNNRKINGMNVKFLWIGGREFGMPKLNLEAPSNLTRLEYVPFSEINSMYSASELFFFPTYAESYGNVLYEAASVGIPVLLRDIKIYHDLVEQGYVMGGKTLDEFEKNIESIVSQHKLRRRMIKKSLELADINDLEKTIDSLIKVYDSLLKG